MKKKKRKCRENEEVIVMKKNSNEESNVVKWCGNEWSMKWKENEYWKVV